MADSAGSSVLQSRQADSSENRGDSMDVLEPEPKKCKFESKDQPVESKLEDRLSGILCCAVCLDVPCLWMYQASVRRWYLYAENVTKSQCWRISKIPKNWKSSWERFGHLPSLQQGTVDLVNCCISYAATFGFTTSYCHRLLSTVALFCKLHFSRLGWKNRYSLKSTVHKAMLTNILQNWLIYFTGYFCAFLVCIDLHCKI